MSEQQWFHGGKPGLKVGGELLPPSITGKPTLFQYAKDLDGVTQREDRVYLTSDAAIATIYAGVIPKGDVYEVEPIGEVEPDPDCALPGLSVQCERARITRIVRRRCPLPAFIVEAKSMKSQRR